jgi:hypothetical protein
VVTQTKRSLRINVGLIRIKVVIKRSKNGQNTEGPLLLVNESFLL